jgi:hypothetical protein
VLVVTVASALLLAACGGGEPAPTVGEALVDPALLSAPALPQPTDERTGLELDVCELTANSTLRLAGSVDLGVAEVPAPAELRLALVVDGSGVPVLVALEARGSGPFDVEVEPTLALQTMAPALAGDVVVSCVSTLVVGDASYASVPRRLTVADEVLPTP